MSAPVMSPNALVITLVALAWLLVLGIPLLVTFCKRQVKSCPRGFARGGEVSHLEREGVPVRLSHGDEFQPFCECPRCHDYALHHVEIPSDYEPVLLDTHKIQTWGGHTVTVTHHEYDRVDERDWAVARTCRSCGHRWGQK